MKKLYLVDGILYWGFEQKFNMGGPNAGMSCSGSDRSDSYIVIADSQKNARDKFLEYMKKQDNSVNDSKWVLDKTEKIENKSGLSLEKRISVFKEAFTIIE